MLKRLFLCYVLLLAACAPGGENQAPTDPHNPPTVAPPEYVEAAQPVSHENAARLSYLGRLDQPGRASTIFAHTFSPDGTRLAALNNEGFLSRPRTSSRSRLWLGANAGLSMYWKRL